MPTLSLGCTLRIPNAQRAAMDERIDPSDRVIRDTHHPRLQAVLGKDYWFEPGRTLRVGFQGGDPALRNDIATWAAEWEEHANIHFSFYQDEQHTAFREWSQSDTDKRADIRIAFLATTELGGYWSAIGNDIERVSDNGEHYPANIPTMNFEDLRSHTPAKQRAFVLHEFGHAIGFLHEHQSPSGDCEAAFRWEDEAGYNPGPLDPNEGYGLDDQGRSPGIYRVMTHLPYAWSRQDVDDNLRTLPSSYAYPHGDFDPLSIMKYYFEPWMYIEGEASPCYTAQENYELSDADKAAAARFYPFDQATAENMIATKHNAIEQILAQESCSDTVKQGILMHK